MSTRQKPNIVMIIAEELRADMLGYMGCHVAETPFLDSLAETSVVFGNHYTVHSKCVPSRAALYSGRYVHVDGHRTLGIPLQKGEINLAKILKDNGYHTALCLKNHTVDKSILDESFDEWWQEKDLPGKAVSCSAYSKETTSHDRTEGNKYADNYLFGQTFINESDKNDYRGTQKVVEFINNTGSETKPFFININFAFTHPPYEIMEPYYSRFMNKDIPLFPNKPGTNKPDFVNKLHELHGFERLDEHDRKEMIATYLGQLNYVDNRVKEIYTALEKANELDNTIFIFTSDHGDFVGQYGLPEKWDTIFHDCLINIPLMIHYPAEFTGNRLSQLTENIDILPTLLDMLKLDHPYGIQGKSLIPVMNDSTVTHKDYVFCEGGHEKELLDIEIQPDPHRKVIVGYLIKAKLREVLPDSLRKAKMIRTNEFKLVYRIKDKNELYDLVNDPTEMNNIYYDKQYNQVVNKLEHILLKHLIETEQNLPFDPVPIS
jgi:arylsulfatase A-like enzyme